MVAISTAAVNQSTRQLMEAMGLAGVGVLLVLGFTLWWLRLLGLTPITRMTAAADRITAGSRDRMVPFGAAGRRCPCPWGHQPQRPRRAGR